MSADVIERPKRGGGWWLVAKTLVPLVLGACVVSSGTGSPSTGTGTPASASAATCTPTAAAPTNAATCANCVIRVDPLLGIRFEAPASYFYRPAAPATSDPFLTSSARLASYSPDPPLPTDLSKELLVEMFLAARHGDDLRTIASTRFTNPAAEQRDIVVAGQPALRLDGEFQNGRRIYVLILVNENVLVIGAFPSGTTRIGDFDRLLQYLVID